MGVMRHRDQSVQIPAPEQLLLFVIYENEEGITLSEEDRIDALLENVNYVLYDNSEMDVVVSLCVQKAQERGIATIDVTDNVS